MKSKTQELYAPLSTVFTAVRPTGFYPILGSVECSISYSPEVAPEKVYVAVTVVYDVKR